MRTYELLAILNPKLDDAARKELVAFVESELSANGSITKNEQWGERQLAYKINASDKGLYVLYHLDSEVSEVVKKISAAFNLKKDIWRFMFTAVEA